MTPLHHIVLVATAVAGSLTALMIWGEFSPWWLLVIVPFSLGFGMFGAMRDED